MAIATQKLRRVDSNSLLTVTRPNAQDYINLAATPDCDYQALESKFWAANPTQDEVADFILYTNGYGDTLARFWACNPSARNIAYVMFFCEFNNPDTLARFWASNPTAEDILYAVEHLGVPVTEELVETFRACNPTANQRVRLEWVYINIKLPELAELIDPLREEEEEE